MRFEGFSFGSLRIDGITHEHDVVIDDGEIRKRKKKPYPWVQGAAPRAFWISPQHVCAGSGALVCYDLLRANHRLER